MKMIAGACLRASRNSRRMRAAPRPANISTNDAADCEKNWAPDSWATALASSVLPVPGGPCSSTPLGTFAPSLRKRLGSRRNSTTSCSSSLASSTPAMSSQPIDDFVSGLICSGLVFGMSFSVRHKKKTMSIMKSSVKSPDHSIPKSFTCSVHDSIHSLPRSARAVRSFSDTQPVAGSGARRAPTFAHGSSVDAARCRR